LRSSFSNAIIYPNALSN